MLSFMKKLTITLFLLCAVSASAQNQFRTAVKFVCGKADSKSTTAFAYSAGSYTTTINVGNLNLLDVSGTKRFSIALLNETPGKFTETIPWTLKPSQSMQIDCGNIWKHTGIFPGTFVEGFVFLIGAPLRFDVTAVYTVRDTGGNVVSMDVDAIALR
jgi:hypothetical protein